MDPTKFDDLTKALATPTSRRQALRRIGGILGGTVLAGLLPGVALADNSACAHFCASVFGVDTPAADQCTSDAAHHTGLCYTCGPASPGGTQPICCPENGSGQCTSYSSATCCTSGQTCLCNGSCATPCTTAADCPDCFACQIDENGMHRYCMQGNNGVFCASDCACPLGQFCADIALNNVCAVLC